LLTETTHMQKFLRSIVTAIVSGLVFFLGSLFILTEIGLYRYDNYEYYGKYWALCVIAGLVGFFLPSILAWLLVRSRGYQGSTPER
jgi:hypothetical protein